MSKHKICIHCKMLEAAAPLGLAGGGEEGWGSLLRQEQLLPPHPHPSHPRPSEPGLWLPMKAPGCLGELHRLPRGWQPLEPARHWLEGVLSPSSVGRAAPQCPSSPGHPRSHSRAGYSSEATAITGSQPPRPSCLSAHAHPSPREASCRQPGVPVRVLCECVGEGVFCDNLLRGMVVTHTGAAASVQA